MRAALLAFAILQQGCGIVYHQMTRHRTETETTKPAPDRKLIRAVTEERLLRPELEGDVVRVSALQRERQSWEVRERTETARVEVCEGTRWDQFLFLLTLGLPCMALEYFLVVPVVVEQTYERQHAQPSRKVVHKDVAQGAVERVEKMEELPAPSIEVAPTLHVGSEAIALGPVATALSRPAEIPIFGKWPRPLPGAGPLLRLRGSFKGEFWASSELPLGDDPSRLACLQGASWELGDCSDAAETAIRATARRDPDSGAVRVDLRLRCSGEVPLYRSGVRVPGGPVFYWGRIDPDGRIREIRLELPYEDQSAVVLEFLEAGGRLPARWIVELEPMEENP